MRKATMRIKALRGQGLHDGRSSRATMIAVTESHVVLLATYEIHLIPRSSAVIKERNQVKQEIMISSLAWFSERRRERL